MDGVEASLPVHRKYVNKKAVLDFMFMAIKVAKGLNGLLTCNRPSPGPIVFRYHEHGFPNFLPRSEMLGQVQMHKANVGSGSETSGFVLGS